jgi:ATP adenylyltransferase
MKTFWTPWRIEHVQGKVAKPVGCLFEPEGTCSTSKKHLLLYRGQQTLVLLNRFPYSNGHLLVAPVRHLSCITELTAAENFALMETVKGATAILKNQLDPDGFNIGCNIGATAGAGIADHLHIHIVPRWDGDHNFISVIGDIRTIPEHIDATFDRLLPEFLNLKIKTA